ncbi:MAG: hypothetical protein HY703_10585 [Gemmatimonadetes bacterium]|nr:hypothetical protein [Gemmatimonadota bacterium]
MAELPRKTVEQAIDRGEVKPVLGRRRGEIVRGLDEPAVVYLRIRAAPWHERKPRRVFGAGELGTNR